MTADPPALLAAFSQPVYPVLEHEPPMFRRSSLAPSLTTSEWLTLAAGRAVREQANTATGELREAVGAYVRDRRQQGYPPERVVVAIKALLADSGLRKSGPLSDRGSSTPSLETDIVDRVVRWCIEEYFAARPHGG